MYYKFANASHFRGGGLKIQMSGPPTKLRCDLAGGESGWAVPHSSLGRKMLHLEPEKQFLSYKQGTLAAMGSLPLETVPHPRKKNMEKGVGAEH